MARGGISALDALLVKRSPIRGRATSYRSRLAKYASMSERNEISYVCEIDFAGSSHAYGPVCPEASAFLQLIDQGRDQPFGR